MEEIRQSGGDNVRDKEALTSAVTDFASSIDSQIDNQAHTTSVLIKRRCRQTDVVTSESAVGDYNSPVPERASTSRRLDTLTMLLQYSKEFLGFLALILTTYATLLNKEPIIGGTLAPKPIFAKDSIVQEWPFGHLGDVQSKVAASELSLIFFYAPWCAESLFAKKVYNAAANVYSKEAYFAAVNCWQPNSGCRTNYSNVYKWPVLMAYFPKAFSVQYNGPWTYSSLTRFIEGLITPMVRVDSVEKLLQLRIANDAVVLGIFKSAASREYQIFFQTAVKWLQTSFENIKFAVHIGEDTAKFLRADNLQAPVIKLFTTNGSVVYDNRSWDSKHVISFIKKNFAKSQIWINLSTSKSSAIQRYLQAGPVLLMFAPRAPLSHHYFIMKQLIYSHKNNQLDLNNTVLNNYIGYIQNEYPQEVDKLSKFCEFTKYQNFQNAMQYDVGTWEDKLYSLGIQTVNTSKHMSNDPHLRDGRDTCGSKHCAEEIFRPKMHHKSKHILDVSDYRSPAELLRGYMQKQCIHLQKLSQTLLQKAVVQPIIPSKALEPKLLQNRSLTFLMLDSVVYNDYLRNFIGSYGIQQYPGSSPALLIVDADNESLYLSKGPISTGSAMKFVEDYYSGKLRRHLRSATIDSKLSQSSSGPVIQIKEIDSRQFSKITKWTNVTSVVLFYSPQCSLCYVMSRTVLHVSHIMNLRNLQFYRIDATANDFSWEYTMEKLPTLMVFPQNRSIETNVFPPTMKITVQNVFGFILSSLKPEQQLKSLINACVQTKWAVAFQNCVHHIRNMIGNEINRNLQQWRRFPSQREVILRRLGVFNGIYMELIRARKGSHLNDILNDAIIYENGDYAYIF